jgi:hypothetical protein
MCLRVCGGGGDERDRRGDCLNAAVEGGGVEALDWRLKTEEVRGELVRLCYAIAGEGGI